MELSVAADDAFEPSPTNGGGRRHCNSDRASAASLRHSLSSPLAQFDRNRLDLAGANHPDLQNITDLRGGKRILDCIHVFDCPSAPFEKYISQQHPGLSCGPIVFGCHDKHPPPRFIPPFPPPVFRPLPLLHPTPHS